MQKNGVLMLLRLSEGLSLVFQHKTHLLGLRTSISTILHTVSDIFFGLFFFGGSFFVFFLGSRQLAPHQPTNTFKSLECPKILASNQQIIIGSGAEGKNWQEVQEATYCSLERRRPDSDEQTTRKVKECNQKGILSSKSKTGGGLKRSTVEKFRDDRKRRYSELDWADRLHGQK